MPFLAFIFYIISSAESRPEIKCVNLEGDDREKLSELFKKVSINPLKLRKIITSNDELGVKTYMKNKDYGQTFRVVKYDLKSEIILDKFEWNRFFLKQLKERGDLVYKIRCFRDNEYGYLIFNKYKEFKTFFRVLREMNVLQLKEYLMNLIKIFREYESLGAVFTQEYIFTFGVDQKEITRPVVAYFNSLQPLKKYFHLSIRNMQLGNKFGENLSSIGVQDNLIEFFRVMPTPNWNMYTLISIMSSYTLLYSNYYRDREIKLDHVELLNAFISKLSNFDDRILSEKKVKIEFGDLENIVAEMTPAAPRKH